jgi:hypothetical protein
MSSFGGIGTSESLSQQTTQTVSDSGQLLGKGATVAQGQSTLLGKGAKLLTPGAFDFSGTKGNISITSSDAEVFSKALDAIQGSNAGFNSSLTTLLDKTTATGSQNLEKVLAQLTPLAESQQTGGASGQNKSVLTLAGLALAAVLFLAWLLSRR